MGVGLRTHVRVVLSGETPVGFADGIRLSGRPDPQNVIEGGDGLQGWRIRSILNEIRV
jgi:hypothetical protein